MRCPHKTGTIAARALSFLIFVLVLVFQAPIHAEPSPASESKPPALETFDAVWQKVYEHHFDTNFNGHNWLAVREQYRPKIAAARHNEDLRRTLQEMIDLLGVSHMSIVPGEISELIEGEKHAETAAVEPADEEETGTVGLDVRFDRSDLIVTRVETNLPAARAGVRAGWLITDIQGMKAPDSVPPSSAKLDEQRRHFLAWRAASRKLAGPPGSEIEIGFLDDLNERRSLRLKRTMAQGEPVQFGSLPVIYTHFRSEEIHPANDRRIGLVRFDIWMLPTALALNKAIDQFRDADGLIIDLRGNIGGTVGMIIGTAGHFVSKPLVLGSLVARDNVFQLPANPRFVDSTGKAVNPYSGPVAVLVDEITASASEVFAGALQEIGRVRVFGRTTSGQALPAVMDELPNGDAFYHPIADFVTPKGTRFEGRGVVPNEKITIDRKALLEGRDRVLERAISWVSAQPRNGN